MKSIKPSYQIRQDLLNALKKKNGIAKELFYIKNSPFAEEALSALKPLIKSIPRFDEKIYGHCFPMEEKELGFCPSAFYRPESLINEIKWIAFQILNNKKTIKLFISYRDRIEKSILLGEYTDALELLEKSRKQIGYSIWYYEMKLLIYGFMGDNERILKLVSEVNKIHKEEKRGYVTLLLHFLHKRSMTKLSALDYDMELSAIFKRNSKTYLKDRDNYFLFRLNFYNNHSMAELPSMLLFESTNSLIDRYILLVLIIKSVCLKKDIQSVAILEIGELLYKKLEDSSLLSVIAYKRSSLPLDYYDKAFVKILDYYYTGSYDKVIELSKSYISENPSDFDIVVLYCHSLILAKKTYSNITNDANSPINQISHLVYLIKNGENIKDNTYKLYQLTKRIYGLSISAGIDNFVQKEQDITDENLLHFMFTKHFDPFVAKIFSSKEDQIEYLEDAQRIIPNSVVIRYQKHRIQNIIDKNDGVVECISSMDNARILHNKKQFDESNSLLIEIREKYSECVPVIQSAVNLSFSNYIEKEDYRGAIDFYVKEYLKNSAYVIKIATKEFVHKLNRKKYKGLKWNLDFLIFAVLNISEESDLSFLLESYCRYLNVVPIKGLLDIFKYEDRTKVERFLALIVQNDFLRHTTFVENTREVLDQLQVIIQYLIKMETPFKEEYLHWQQSLSEEMIAYEGRRKVDESKIYANKQAIIKYELEDARRLYEQYSSQSKLQHGKYIYIILDKLEHISNEDIKNVWSNGVHFTDNSLKEISYQLYDKIRYKFLKSKFGLGTYLSTRIRHGVFEGHIRSVFDEISLVLNMENERYVPIPYWKNRFALTDEENEILMNELERFSVKVDKCISYFKSNVLQIRLNEEDKGEFNYILSDDKICMDVLKVYNQSDSFEAFCEKLMYTMCEVTEANLMRVRTIIKGEFMKTLRSALDELLPVTDKISNQSFKNYFIKSLSDCRSQLERCITNVSEWFHMQDTKFDDFEFAKQLDIVWDISCKMHPSVNCKMNAQCVKNLWIKGEYCIHISDLLRIFITNMMQHSKMQPNRDFSINVNIENEDTLRIVFINECDGNAEELNSKFAKLLSSEERLQKEGGSGLVKARKIVRYDLGCLDNEVCIHVDGNICKSDITISLKNLLANGKKNITC